MNSVLRKPLALLLSALLCAPACASAGRPRYQVAQTSSSTQPANDTA